LLCFSNVANVERRWRTITKFLSTKISEKIECDISKILEIIPVFNEVKDLGIDYTNTSYFVRNAVLHFVKNPPSIEQVKEFSHCKDVSTMEFFLDSIIKSGGSKN
jgi:hypothetical protein